MATLKTLVQDNENPYFQRIQEILRFNHNYLNESEHTVDEFINLVSTHFTFVNDWNDPKISHMTYWLYGRKVLQRKKKKICCK